MNLNSERALQSVCLILLLTLSGIAAALGTAFTYQGVLKDGGMPANANYNFVFRLFDDASAGVALLSEIMSPVVGLDAPRGNRPVPNGPWYDPRSHEGSNRFRRRDHPPDSHFRTQETPHER